MNKIVEKGLVEYIKTGLSFYDSVTDKEAFKKTFIAGILMWVGLAISRQGADDVNKI